jgi:RNA polymerase sigma factor (sigma-70 family)
MVTDELIQGCLRGDRRSQRDLYMLCHPILFRVGLRYTKNQETAMEIVTNAYLKILKNIASVNQQQNSEAWVRRIGVNTAIDYYRSQKKYADNIKLESDYSYNVIEHIHIDSNTMDKHLEASYIVDLLKRLPDHTREVMNLFAIDGYSHREIGSLLKITEETSRWHVFKARKLLSEQIKKYQEINIAK